MRDDFGVELGAEVEVEVELDFKLLDLEGGENL